MHVKKDEEFKLTDATRKGKTTEKWKKKKREDMRVKDDEQIQITKHKIFSHHLPKSP